VQQIRSDEISQALLKQYLLHIATCGIATVATTMSGAVRLEMHVSLIVDYCSLVKLQHNPTGANAIG
jgi:nicotinamidase-related amidase